MFIFKKNIKVHSKTNNKEISYDIRNNNKTVAHGGFILWSIDNSASFIDFEVLPNFRRMGLATLILQRLVKSLRIRKVNDIAVFSEPDGLKFWKTNLPYLRKRFSKVKFRKVKSVGPSLLNKTV